MGFRGSATGEGKRCDRGIRKGEDVQCLFCRDGNQVPCMGMEFNRPCSSSSSRVPYRRLPTAAINSNNFTLLISFLLQKKTLLTSFAVTTPNIPSSTSDHVKSTAEPPTSILSITPPNFRGSRQSINPTEDDDDAKDTARREDPQARIRELGVGGVERVASSRN
jgi:hypothetical protein